MGNIIRNHNLLRNGKFYSSYCTTLLIFHRLIFSFFITKSKTLITMVHTKRLNDLHLPLEKFVVSKLLKSGLCTIDTLEILGTAYFLIHSHTVWFGFSKATSKKEKGKDCGRVKLNIILRGKVLVSESKELHLKRSWHTSLYYSPQWLHLHTA